MRPTCSRPGIGELAGSLSMLAITMALLAGASTVALLSIHQAAALVTTSDQKQQTEIGLLIDVVGTQSNSSGTYVWLYDYGWVSAPVQEVYVDARRVPWHSTCGWAWVGALCLVDFQSTQGGEATIIVGGVSIAARV